MKLPHIKTSYHKIGHFIIDEYKPTILRPFPIQMEPLTLFKRARFLIDRVFGYRVYYIRSCELGDNPNKYIGYCTVTSGKNPRFFFANKKDIVIGPYYVDEKSRGKGWATKLVETVITLCEKDWENAYVMIKNSNVSSIKVTEKLGGKLIFHVHNTIFKRLKKTDKGEYGIYRIKNSGLNDHIQW